MRKLVARLNELKQSYAGQQLPSFTPEAQLVLGIVTDFTAVIGGTYRWRYTVKEAKLEKNTTPQQWVASAKTNGIVVQALSVSEMSNAVSGGNYAYGVPASELPAGWTPRRIPTGTIVVMAPWRAWDTGENIWLIINAQAISGVCPT